MPPEFKNQEQSLENQTSSFQEGVRGKFSLYLGLVVVFVVIVGIFFFYSRNVSEKPNIEEVAEWQTYRNEEYGFEFKYPSNYIVEELEDEKGRKFYTVSDPVLEGKIQSYNSKGSDAPTHAIFIIPNKNFNELKGEVLFSDNFSFTESYFKQDEWQTYLGSIIISGRKGFQFRHCEFTDVKYTVFKNTDSTFFVLNTLNTDNESHCLSQVHNSPVEPYDTILSTFKFISTSTPTIGTGQFCGGIAAIQCPIGYECILDGNYPDAGGKCQVYKKQLPPDMACITVVAPAKNIETGEVYTFGDPCSVSEGWEPIKSQ